MQEEKPEKRKALEQPGRLTSKWRRNEQKADRKKNQEKLT